MIRCIKQFFSFLKKFIFGYDKDIEVLKALEEYDGLTKWQFELIKWRSFDEDDE